LLERAGRLPAIRYGDPRPFVGIVHRLDTETSGAIALARSVRATRAFQELFRAHDIERQYLAVVEGRIPRSSGTIDVALVSDRGDLKRGVARRPDEGRHAVTHFRVLERFGEVATLVACWLETAERTRSESIWPKRATRSSAIPSIGLAVAAVPESPSRVRPSTLRRWASATH